VNSGTNPVYIADYFSGTVLVLDGASNTVTATIQTPSVHIGFVAADPSSNVVYAANYKAAPSVTVINGSSTSIITSVALQQQRRWFALFRILAGKPYGTLFK
jgi:YVTN family beta-propeller protein